MTQSPPSPPDAEQLLQEAQALYDNRDYGRAAATFEQAAAAATQPTKARQALTRAASVYWYNLNDRSATLRALVRLGASQVDSPAVKALLERVVESLLEELRLLVRRGDLKEGYRRIAELRPLIAPDRPHADEIVSIYLAELCGQNYAAVDLRLSNLTRKITQLAAGSTAGEKPAEKLDRVATGLTAYALEEEQKLLTLLLSDLRARELEVLDRGSADAFADHIERSRDDVLVRELLDRIHVLALERMHYRTRLRLEVKDQLVRWLPRSLAAHVVDDVYLRVVDLEAQVASLQDTFLARAYPKPA